MPTTAPEGRLHVAVGVLRDGANRYLMQQRPAGKPCAGQWEFPGGKVEPGESSREALCRELFEELGIESLQAALLVQIPYDYEHARVWLDVYLVDRFSGNAEGREGQSVWWLQLEEIEQRDILAAVPPILDCLRHCAA